MTEQSTSTPRDPVLYVVEDARTPDAKPLAVYAKNTTGAIAVVASYLTARRMKPEEVAAMYEAGQRPINSARGELPGDTQQPLPL